MCDCLLDHFIQEGELRTDYARNGNWQDLNTWHHDAAQVTKNDVKLISIDDVTLTI